MSDSNARSPRRGDPRIQRAEAADGPRLQEIGLYHVQRRACPPAHAILVAPQVPVLPKKDRVPPTGSPLPPRIS